MYYFNTAALGKPVRKVWTVLSAFNRIVNKLGPRSESVDQLIRGEYPLKSRSVARDCEIVCAEWMGFEDLARTLAEIGNVKLDNARIALLPGTSDAIEIALRTIQDVVVELVTTDLEHQSEVDAIRACWRKKIKVVKLRDRILSGATKEEVVTTMCSALQDGRAILISHVTAEYGTILPIKEILAFGKSKFRRFFAVVDGAHGFGNINPDLSKIDYDFYVSSGHKWLRGPASSAFVSVNCTVPRIEKEFQSQLLRSYSWFDLRPGIKLGQRDLTLSVRGATQSFSPFVGLKVALNQLKRKPLDGIQTRVAFENVLRGNSTWRLENDHIALEKSRISTIRLCRPVRLSSRTEKFRSIAGILEREYDIICEAQNSRNLRLSFSGDEKEKDLSFLRDALASVSKYV